jgi:S1-C subfamily serine protease
MDEVVVDSARSPRARRSRFAIGVLLALFAGSVVGAGACRRHAPAPRGVDAAVATPLTPRKPGPPPPTTPKLEMPSLARTLSDSFASAAQAIRPCVVRLDVEGSGGEEPGHTRGPGSSRFLPPSFAHPLQRRVVGPRSSVLGTGSGVIIDAAGNILTNSHVVRGAEKVTIRLVDQRSFPGKVIGADPLTDVAVVRFETPPPDLIEARLGNSDRLRTGEWVIAIGSPLGMEQTVTAGIVSGVGETGSHFRFQSGERVRKYIQTDAEINPGNSGGPLVDLQGEVMGINTLINVGPGGSYGFAIPINEAFEVARVLVKEGRMRYPYIGVSVVNVSDAPRGLLVRAGKNTPVVGALAASVTPGGPAGRAGIAAGDIITRVAGLEIKTASDLLAAVSAQRIGDTVEVQVSRNGTARAGTIKIVEYERRSGRAGHRGARFVAVASPPR